MSGYLRKVTASTDKLGTARDTKAMREKMHAALKAGFALAKDMKKDLQQFGPCISSVTGAEKNQRRIQKQKFVKDTGKLVKAFEAAAKRAVERERESVARARKSLSDGHPSAGALAGEPARRDSAAEETRIAFEAQEQDLVFNELLMDEREGTIEEIQRSLLDARDTFVDLAHLVEEQGHDMDTMEWNIQESHARTERGVKHIKEAAKHQKSYRKTICWFMLILLLVAGGVGVFIYLRTR